MYHTWIEISRKAFEHNIRFYKNVIGHDAALALVIKSNAYGHGIHEIAKLGQENSNVDWFCATALSEALILRETGITKPILVMTLMDDYPAKIFSYDIAIIAHDIDTIKMLNTLGQTFGKKAKVHIKIDTGMSRFGFYPDEALAVIKQIKETMPYVAIQGIYTHFSDVDSSDQSYSYQQLQQFNTVLDALREAKISIAYKHTCKTSAITTVDNSHFNFVRLGAGAYGLSSSTAMFDATKKRYSDFNPQQIMSWKTRIMHIRDIPANTYVGYDRTYKTTKPTTVAMLPVGYYEGYDRRLTNNGVVKNQVKQNCTEDRYAPVIGRICMNITMIDITSMNDVKVGDDIILLGNYPGIRAYDLAQNVESFNPREITTRINPLIPRIITE